MRFENFYSAPRQRQQSTSNQSAIKAFRERERANRKAFYSVLRVYIDALEHSAPYGSSLALLDPSARPQKWSPDTANTIIDVERAVQHALGNNPELLKKFRACFVLPELEPDINPPRLNGEVGEFVQRCGKEFRRRGMHPLWRWFGLEPREANSMSAGSGVAMD